MLGVEHVQYEALSWGLGAKATVAGLIDRQQGVIAVSRAYSSETMRFTGAHELGHYLLHEDEVMHRDLPVDGGCHSQVAHWIRGRVSDSAKPC
jgi:Zn-dependent peptidase ImmA (M78 family)